MKKTFYPTLFVSASVFCAGIPAIVSGQQARKQMPQRPNILVLLTDDQSYNTIAALGNRQVVTPNIDYLVSQGTALTETHVMGGLQGAISQPSRAMLLTGRQLFNLHQDGRIIPEQDKTFPEVFRANGYETFGTGKWHSDKASFNRSFSTGANIFFGGMVQYETDGHFRPFLHDYDPSGRYAEGYFRPGFSSQIYADGTIEFLLERRRDKPFLAYVAFNSPHDPRTPPPAYGHKYDPQEVGLPLNFMRQHPFNNGDLDVRDEVFLPTPRDPGAVSREIAAYYGMVSEVDTQIGRIVAALKASGQFGNTIIVFTSDNGLAVGSHGLLGKQNLYEHSSKVPLVIAGPGVSKGEKRGAYCYLFDIYPTLCEMTGVPVPEGVDGRSLKDVVTGSQNTARDYIFLSYINIQRAVKKDGVKLVMYNVDGQRRIQLFDLVRDPLEIDNLADAPAYKDKLEELSALLGQAMRESGDICDPDKPAWGYPARLTYSEILEINL